jgi:hypothetical protein
MLCPYTGLQQAWLPMLLPACSMQLQVCEPQPYWTERIAVELASSLAQIALQNGFQGPTHTTKAIT